LVRQMPGTRFNPQPGRENSVQHFVDGGPVRTGEPRLVRQMPGTRFNPQPGRENSVQHFVDGGPVRTGEPRLVRQMPGTRFNPQPGRENSVQHFVDGGPVRTGEPRLDSSGCSFGEAGLDSFFFVVEEPRIKGVDQLAMESGRTKKSFFFWVRNKCGLN
jgi:hypothetical protein